MSSESTRAKPIWISLVALAGFIGMYAYFIDYYSQRGIELDFSMPLRMIFFLAAFVVPQGYFLLTAIGFDARRSGCSRHETLTVAVGAGYIFSSFAGYFMKWSGIPYLYEIFSVFVLAKFVAAAMKDRALAKERARGFASEIDAVACLLAALAAARFFTTFCWLSKDGPFEYRQFLMDSRFHLSIVNEMFRGIPLKEFPLLSGEPFYRYHILGHCFAWLASSLTGTDSSVVFHLGVPVFFTVLLTAQYYFMGKRFGGGKLYGYAAVVLMFFLYLPFSRIGALQFADLKDHQLHGIYSSFTSLAGLPILAGFLHLFAIWTGDKNEPAPAVAASVFVSSLFLFKVNFFMMAWPAFMVVLAANFAARKPLRAGIARAFAASAFSLALCAIIYMRYADVRQTALMFAANAKDILGRYTALGPVFDDMMKTSLGRAELAAAGLMVPALMAGLANAFLAACFFILARRKDEGGDLRLLTLLFMLCVLLMCYFVVDPEYPMNPILCVPVCAYAFFTAPAAAGMRLLASRFSGSRFGGEGFSRAAGFIVIAIAIASVRMSASRTFLANGFYHYPVDRDEYRTLTRAAAIAPGDSVFLCSNYDYGIDSLFAGRRTVAGVEWSGLHFRKEYDARAADIRKLFATESAREAAGILKKYSADYVVASGGERIRFPIKGTLKEEYRSGSARLYSVDRSGR